VIHADDDADDYEPDYDDWDDRDDDSYEPDPSDYEEQRAQEEYAEHCDERHGGGECDCRPPWHHRLRCRLGRLLPWRGDPWRLPLRDRIRYRLRRSRHQPYDDEPPF
jgi:hypothetical protein